MPSVGGVIETALYVEDMGRAERFYQDVFGFTKMVGDERFCALSVSGSQVLLLFRKGASRDAIATGGGLIPGHDGSGTTHLAFTITEAEWDGWAEWLAAKGVTVESVVRWPRGGRSAYFRDPDSHLLELITPGCWPIY